MSRASDELGAAAETRIAYFITSYRSSEQLARLLTTLRTAQPAAELIVHHDEFQVPLDPSVVSNVGGHLMTSPFPIVWGDGSLDRARFRVIRWALENLDFEWMVMLSEQDYPVAPLHSLALRLGTCGADAVLDAEKLEDIEDADRRAKTSRLYLYRYHAVPALGLEERLPERWQRLARRSRELAFGGLARLQSTVVVHQMPHALRLGHRVGVRAGRRSPFSAEFPCWTNSAWFALSRSGARRLLELLDERPDLVEYYEHTIIPLESLTSTLLCNAPDVRVELAALHHVRWGDARSGRPDVFTEEDFDELVDSGCSFARKFDVRQPAILDRLDDHVLEPAPAPVAPVHPLKG